MRAQDVVVTESCGETSFVKPTLEIEDEFCLITNAKHISSQMQRPPSVLALWLSEVCNVRCRFDGVRGVLRLAGQFISNEVDNALREFLYFCVICPCCRGSSTKLSSEQSAVVLCCADCGSASPVGQQKSGDARLSPLHTRIARFATHLKLASLSVDIAGNESSSGSSVADSSCCAPSTTMSRASSCSSLGMTPTKSALRAGSPALGSFKRVTWHDKYDRCRDPAPLIPPPDAGSVCGLLDPTEVQRDLCMKADLQERLKCTLVHREESEGEEGAPDEDEDEEDDGEEWSMPTDPESVARRQAEAAAAAGAAASLVL
eukprot:tig00000615_g2557.t1